MRKFFSEFKTFAIKGNMFDLAVGVIIGGSFSAIVTSLVTNIATPLLGILIGVDFKEWVIPLPRLYGNAEPGMLNIGLFLNSIITFIIVAFTVFLFVKMLNKLRKKQETPATPEPPPEPTAEEKLLAEIRDILRDGNTAGGNKEMPDTIGNESADGDASGSDAINSETVDGDTGGSETKNSDSTDGDAAGSNT